MIEIIWHDADGTTTKHEFEAPERAAEWLSDVLNDVGDEDFKVWMCEEHGPDTTATGLHLLAYYTGEGGDWHGTFDLFVDGAATSPDDLL